MLKEIPLLAFEAGDIHNFKKYGEEYLKTRLEFENEHDSLENVIEIMFNLG